MTGRHGGNQGGRPPVHGMSRTPIHQAWSSMIDRCTRVNHKFYSHYGARGIMVCKEWQSFENFLRDMGSTYKLGLTLERRDNNQGYNFKNCYWATWTQQARNRRSSKIINTPKGQMLLCEASEISGLKVETLFYRLKKGWPTSRLFDAPNRGKRISI
jgi:hypothetical protein